MNSKLIEEALSFIDAQREAERHGKNEFVCPVCGGKATWDRVKSNGHLHASCTKCHLWVKE